MKNKHLKNSFFTAKDEIKYLKKNNAFPKFKIPKSIIFCYDDDFFNDLLKKEKLTKTNFNYLYLINSTNDTVGIVGHFGIGAPNSTRLLEIFIALGIKKFISFDTCGSLQKNINIGDFIICNKAIRDEGVSYHYVKPSKFAYSSKKLFINAKNIFNLRKVKYFAGASWTIDAPYRETIEELKKYQKENILCVEMEASALYSVSKFRNVDIICLFTISDSLSGLIWNPKFLFNDMNKSLYKLYNLSIDILK